MTRAALALVGLLSACGGLFATPGTPCKKHEECTGIKDGYCARAEICTRECSDGKPCPEGSACFVGGKRSVCLPSCTKDDDCLPNFFCTAEQVCRLRSPLDPPPM